MSKELEALRKIGSLSTQTYTENGISATLTSQLVKDNCEYKIIEKALTPPTAEEVCKALSEYVGKKVFVDKRYKMTTFIIERENIIATINNGNRLYVSQLPPHLIELVAKFYKGESK